jgi:hypothetical protein
VADEAVSVAHSTLSKPNLPVKHTIKDQSEALIRQHKAIEDIKRSQVSLNQKLIRQCRQIRKSGVINNDFVIEKPVMSDPVSEKTLLTLDTVSGKKSSAKKITKSYNPPQRTTSSSSSVSSTPSKPSSQQKSSAMLKLYELQQQQKDLYQQEQALQDEMNISEEEDKDKDEDENEDEGSGDDINSETPESTESGSESEYDTESDDEIEVINITKQNTVKDYKSEYEDFEVHRQKRGIEVCFLRQHHLYVYYPSNLHHLDVFSTHHSHHLSIIYPSSCRFISIFIPFLTFLFSFLF